MERLITGIVLLIIYCMPVYVQAQDNIKQTLKLSECIAIALKNNPTVQRSTIQSEAVRINLQQSKANLFPVLNANVIHGINQGRSIDPFTNAYVNQQVNYANQELNSSLLLFNGMALQNAIRQSSLAFQAAKQEEQQIKDNLSLNIILTYLQVLTNQDLLALAYKQQETTIKQVERLEVLHNNGGILPGEYYDLKGQFSNDQLAVINTKNNLENAKLALVQLLNIPFNKNMELEQFTSDQYTLLYELSAEQVYQSAIQSLAMVKAADFAERSANVRVKYTRGGYYPSIYLRGGLVSNFSSAAHDVQNRPIGYVDQFNNNLGKSVSVAVVIPLFNGLRTKNAVSLAKLYHKETVLLAQNTRTQLQQLIEQAYFNMTAAKDRYVTLQNQVAAFSESFRIAEVRFNAGAINAVDYLVSKNNLEKAKINFVAVGYDFILRKKILDFYQGKLLL